MNDSPIKRVFVALDSSETNRSLLLIAGQLAATLDAQLLALFVEDINLLRMACLPVAREVSASSRTTRQLTLLDMERQLHSQVQRMRRFVETVALQFDMPVEFKVLRGQIAAELCTAVQKMDLLVVGKNTQLQRYSEKLGSITQDMLQNANCDLLLLRHGALFEKPVAVFYTGSVASDRALRLAIRLARRDAGQLTVLYPATDKSQLAQWQEQVAATFRPFDISAEHYVLDENSPQGLLSVLTAHKSRVVIFDGRQPYFDQTGLQWFISQCQTPVALIR